MAPPNRPMVDIGSAIDALSSGASSLIRQAYLRKQAEADRARQAVLDQQQRDAIAYQHEQDRLNREQHAQELAYQHSQDTAKRQLEERGLRLKELEAGVSPRTERYDVPPQTSATINAVQLPQSPIRRAMQAPAQPGQMPGLAEPIPAAPPAPQPTTVSMPGGTVVSPESYDPERSKAVLLAQVRAEEAANRQEDKQRHDFEMEAVKQQNRIATKKFASVLAEKGINLRASIADQVREKKLSSAAAITAQDKVAQKNADGFFDYVGDVDRAIQFLESPDGEDLRRSGVTRFHLMASAAKANQEATRQAMAYQRSVEASPAEAVGRQKETGGRVRTTPHPPYGPPSAPPGGLRPGLVPPTTTAPPAPTPPVGQPPVSPTPRPSVLGHRMSVDTISVPPAAAGKPSAFTAEEIQSLPDSVLNGGPAKVSAYILEQRKKKKTPAPKAGKPTASISDTISNKEIEFVRDGDGNVTGMRFVQRRQEA